MSLNVVTIRVLDAIGLDPVYQLARKLGITSPMEVDLAMGLGAASLQMPELARAYSVFATNGTRVDDHYIDRVTDRDGKALETWTQPAAWEQVLDPGAAGVTSWLLGEVARSGTPLLQQDKGLLFTGHRPHADQAVLRGDPQDMIPALVVDRDARLFERGEHVADLRAVTVLRHG
jgi:penicillin-binding protein 1A